MYTVTFDIIKSHRELIRMSKRCVCLQERLHFDPIYYNIRTEFGDKSWYFSLYCFILYPQTLNMNKT